jgi:HTH-type transcriptional regulator, sugar sensing transcriptional regulator
MLEKTLEKIGLSENEAKIYLVGLAEGPLSASLLARKTDLKRQNVYAILSKLTGKGLVTISGRKYETRFVMQKPESLNSYLDKREHDVAEARKDLSLVLPELQSILKNDSAVPKITFHEGKEDMRRLFLDTLQCKNKQIFAIVASADIYEILGKDFTKYYIEERTRRKIKADTIRIKSREEYDDDFFHKHKEHFRNLRYAPESFNFNSTFFIYDNKITFISSKKESFAVTIESEEYRLLQESLFKSLWVQCEK